MILLNFSHPLTPAQQGQIEALAGQPVAREIALPAQFDIAQPFVPQVRALLEAVGLSPVEWQTEALLLVLPSLNFAAAILLAELHGRMGYFPAVARLRPVARAVPPQFEVAEIINLQAAREECRRAR